MGFRFPRETEDDVGGPVGEFTESCLTESQVLTKLFAVSDRLLQPVDRVVQRVGDPAGH
jgi:hypothetical protein